MIIVIIALVGVALSLYACIVEQKIKTNPEYKPACNLSDVISCTKPMESPYSKLFFISNTYLGIIYYCAMILLTVMGYNQLAFLLAISGVIMSAIFAYLLYFKIKALCLICTSIYLVNIALLIATYMNQ
jgi:uncharacterized membrane protein